MQDLLRTLQLLLEAAIQAGKSTTEGVNEIRCQPLYNTSPMAKSTNI